MKTLTAFVAALCSAVAAGTATAAIPADGGFSDGLRIVYETPVTPTSAGVRERYRPCRGPQTWCRFMPALRQAPAADPVGAQPVGTILSIPLADWKPL
jgi:hypothetical protein